MRVNATLPKLTEKQFMGQIIELARLYNWLVFHTFDARRCEPGLPDLLLLKRGKLIVMECKVGKNSLTHAQERWLDAFRQVAGCTALVVYPRDWSKIEFLLTG